MQHCNNCNEIYVSGSSTKYAIDVSNNKSRYYAELAEQYKNEAKEFRDNAKYYAEQNSDVTMSYIDSLEVTLRNLISAKQDSGNYALVGDIPTKLSDLDDDSNFITTLPTASTSELGLVKPDDDTINIDSNGVISADFSTINTQLQNVINKDRISNCILEIPQNIKFELNNGILTLKSGSKIYIPNGFEQDGTTPKFDTLVIENDLSLGDVSSSANGNRVLYYQSDSLSYVFIDNTSSGSSSSPTNQHWLWYDTTNNLIKRTRDTGSTWTSEASFPICLFTITNGTGVTSINQTFNGFGFIGSTIFALPNVKGLIPNGRNADGSLKNTEFTTSEVTILSESSADGTRYYGINASGEVNRTGFVTDCIYNEPENVIERYTDGSIYNIAICGTYTITSGRITSMFIKTAFHSVDYSSIKGWSLPSGIYKNLTLGASGSTYVAPADGWFCLNKGAGSSAKYIGLGCNSIEIQAHSFASGDTLETYIPVRRGGVVTAFYNATGTTNYFRFIYAVGSESEVL